MPLSNLDDTAKQILEAASRRFMHYGYKKTAMSEIAKDCDMSAGNLYRYFPSKLDIAETFVRVLRLEHLAQLQAVAAERGCPAAERLRRFFILKFQLSYDRFHDKPKAFELSSELIAARPKVALEWEAAEGRILADILRVGAAEGAFYIENPEREAKILQDAAFRFTSAAVFHEGEFDELLDELNGVLDLVLDGFAWRAAQKPLAKASIAKA